MRTEWETKDLPNLLSQIEGVFKAPSPIRFAGRRTKDRGAYLIPKAALDAMGITLELTEDPARTPSPPADQQSEF